MVKYFCAFSFLTLCTENVNSCCRTKKTGAPRNPEAAAVLSDAAGSGTSVACQNLIEEGLQAGSPEVAQARNQPGTKTFKPSSYFPKGYSKLVSLR
jgi:hypothetical protein